MLGNGASVPVTNTLPLSDTGVGLELPPPQPHAATTVAATAHVQAHFIHFMDFMIGFLSVFHHPGAA
jgi:hypothetical protein